MPRVDLTNTSSRESYMPRVDLTNTSSRESYMPRVDLLTHQVERVICTGWTY